jgi:ribosomal-protein-alanine N-acetyltransferase
LNTKTAEFHPVVRFLSVVDIDRVMEIEQSAYEFPWTRGIFEDCLRVGYECRGLQLGSSLIGYTIQTQFAGECHLLNLCVEPGWQGRHFGSLLLEQVICQARKGNCSSMFLEVRPSNRTAISMYKKRCFYIVGQRPDYYRSRQGREDATIMRLDLDPVLDERELSLVRDDPL